jgi:hypothetical protein
VVTLSEKPGCEHSRFDKYIVDLNADCLCGCMDIGRYHKIFKFPNGYGASVISGSKLQGDSGYKVLTLRFTADMEYEVVNVPGTGTSIAMCADWDAALRTLELLENA